MQAARPPANDRSASTQQAVLLARDGDLTAYRTLVADFRPLAINLAYGWLGDRELARDVSQEAFLEAFLRLEQLREPAAFSGWFRRIVQKHCDRITRRASHKLDARSEPLIDQPATVDGAEPSRLISEAQRITALRNAVEALPPAERLVIALHYFAELSGPDLAQLLHLSLPAVKKRLHRARGRLAATLNPTANGHELEDSVMTRTFADLKAQADQTFKEEQFDEEVTFFIAIRQGDAHRVAAMIAANPALLEAEQNWDHALVHRGLLPFPNRATPLITAIELDRLDLLELLLDAGADVNGRCGCTTAEAPLWAATLFHRVDHARLLLARRADPDITSAGGNRPLHVAAMRGYVDLCALLLEHGADPAAGDAGPIWQQPWSPAGEPPADVTRTALEWARIGNHQAVVELLEAATGKQRTAAAPPHAKPTRSAATGAAARIETADLDTDRLPPYYTGIRALDLLAPIHRGGLIRVPFRAGVGMVVLFGELTLRHRRTFGTANTRSPIGKGRAKVHNQDREHHRDRPAAPVIWTGFAQRPYDVGDWHAEIAELGLADAIALHMASFDSSAEQQRLMFRHGIAAAHAAADGGADVLLFLASEHGFEHDIETCYGDLLARTQRGARGSITSIVTTPFLRAGERITETPRLARPFTTQITLDRARVQQRLLPAICPTHSSSLEPTTPALDEMAARAREVLHHYESHDPTFTQYASQDPSDTRTVAAGKRLLQYLSQPFHVTSAFTGRPGEDTAIDTLIAELTDLLADTSD